MKNSILSVIAASLSASILASVAPAQAADDFPNRPITLLVPYTAGGSTDVTARALATAVQPLLGESIVVQNRPGAAATLALSELSRAEPDGYTISFISVANISLAPVMQKVNYDPLNDFVPIMNYGRYVTLLVTNNDSPYKTLDDLVQDMKANPGKVVIGSAGTTNQLGVARLMQSYGVQVEFAPYSGGAQLIPAVIGGHVQVGAMAGEVVPQLKDGRVRGLVSLSSESLPGTENVPTLKSLGFDWEQDSWFGLAAPAGTPPAVVERLSKMFIEATKDPAFVNTMEQMAVQISVRDATELAETMRESYAENEVLLKSLGLARKD